jgi:hypothetical protein
VRTFILEAIVVTVLVPALRCSSVPHARDDSSAWTGGVPCTTTPDGGRTCAGFAPAGPEGPSASGRAAVAEALKEVVFSLGVHVEASTEVVYEDTGGGAPTYRVKSRAAVWTGPIGFREFTELARHESRGPAGTWARVKVPGREVDRLHRVLEGLTALTTACEPANLCPPDLHDRLASVAGTHGLKVVRPEASRPGAAFLLEVRVEPTRQEKRSEEHYVWARLVWRLIAGDTGETKEIVVGPVKGAAYSTREAFADALTQLLDRLGHELEAVQ